MQSLKVAVRHHAEVNRDLEISLRGDGTRSRQEPCDGPIASGTAVVVQAYPALNASGAAQAAKRPAPTCPRLPAALMEDHLVVFNLSGSAKTDAVSIPHDGSTITLFQGTQVTEAGATRLTTSVEAAGAQVLAPRFVAKDIGYLLDATDHDVPVMAATLARVTALVAAGG